MRRAVDENASGRTKETNLPRARLLMYFLSSPLNGQPTLERVIVARHSPVTFWRARGSRKLSEIGTEQASHVKKLALFILATSYLQPPKA